MKKTIFGIALVALAGLVYADPWNSAKSRNAGNYPESYATTITTHTATAIIANSIGIYSANIDIFNNSAYAIYIGSNTATLESTGFPIRSSTTYTLDGTFTGTLYALAEAAAGGDTNVRTIYYQKNDALR